MPRCVASTCRAKLGLVQFDCSFCKNSYCSYHRLPEAHQCTCMDEARNKHRDINKKMLDREACRAAKVDTI
jgi:predicted nucleic acid binding AN1-type Zn finger protein